MKKRSSRERERERERQRETETEKESERERERERRRKEIGSKRYRERVSYVKKKKTLRKILRLKNVLFLP